MSAPLSVCFPPGIKSGMLLGLQHMHVFFLRLLPLFFHALIRQIKANSMACGCTPPPTHTHIFLKKEER